MNDNDSVVETEITFLEILGSKPTPRRENFCSREGG